MCGGVNVQWEFGEFGSLRVFQLILPLPTMTNGLSAAFKTEMASVIASWSAILTGGGGQQDTTLQQEYTSLNI